ncbi:MAG: sigma-70 family RNA polymerase sigma factor [Pirellulales bacterium]
MDEWDQVYERYGSLVWATVYRILGNHAEALDCCQDVFAEVFDRCQAGEVREWAAFLRWLATRRALDRLRRHRAESGYFEANGDLAVVPAATAGPDARANFSELTDRLKRELSRLSPQQAEAFWLLSVEQMSYQEIAEQLGVEGNQVGVLVHRARRRLRESLADLNPRTQEIRSAPRTA